MSRSFDLGAEAFSFATTLTDLLNGTVCNGIRLRSVITPKRDRAVVGYEISRTDTAAAAGIPLTIGPKKPSAFLLLLYRLQADDEGKYLTVWSSVAGLAADKELRQLLFHYDYERNKPEYPEAHLQVIAEPPAWAEIGPAGRSFERVHLPVGGRRNRPTLEDLIEFVVTEDIAEARPGWQGQLERERENFYKRQLKAAIRRDPETARETLRELGK